MSLKLMKVGLSEKWTCRWLSAGVSACPTCTFINSKSRDKCEMCQGPMKAGVGKPIVLIPGGGPYTVTAERLTDTQAQAALEPGMNVEVVKEFTSTSGTKLTVGLKGTVEDVDEDGGTYIMFDGIGEGLVAIAIFKRNFDKLGNTKLTAGLRVTTPADKLIRGRWQVDGDWIHFDIKSTSTGVIQEVFEDGGAKIKFDGPVFVGQHYAYIGPKHVAYMNIAVQLLC